MDPSAHPLEIVPFAPRQAAAVADLIVGIQRREFDLPITADDQPDLQAIPAFYQVRSGNFWVASRGGRAVGTISLLDIGSGQGALRKMFVAPDHRGPGHGTARRLLDTLLAWARERGFREIYLGTTPAFLAAHRFYEKHGFDRVERSALPAAFPVMEVDDRFYRLAL